MKAFQKPVLYLQVDLQKSDAEEIWYIDYSEDLNEIPSLLKGLTSIWDSFLEDRRMYFMFSSQQYEVVVDNTEKVTYGGVDFIKEEGKSTIDLIKKYYYFLQKSVGRRGIGILLAMLLLKSIK